MESSAQMEGLPLARGMGSSGLLIREKPKNGHRGR